MAEPQTEDQYPDVACVSDVPSIAEIRDHGDQRRERTNHRTEDISVSTGQNPAKIFHELKDSDEWMNAHEELKSKQMTEQRATETLLYIALEAFQFSRQEANAVLEKMLKQSHCIISGQKTSKTNQKSSTTTVEILKRYIFAHRESAVARLTKGFFDSPALKKICEQFCINGIGKATEQYTKACIAVTWSATVDETPIEIQIPKRGEIVDRHKFDPYISRGDKIDFVVWPAILLQDGRLLYKGVVELKANHK
ncbi:hypothetical protein MAR_022340 [Mya arenaria]|uniref:Mitochondria-eating protein C-terminal domain-containing protein n=2 Tax=Mya arenaria TaxID=6604 RepID=A0ABY7DML8_MYAAR|nr:hypothetical protein MAR_022340 [Mya arenaria]